MSRCPSFFDRCSRLTCTLLQGAALFFPLCAAGAEQPAAEAPAQPGVLQWPAAVLPDVLPEVLDGIDVSRDYVAEKIVSFASEIDRFFGGERNFQEANRSVFQLEYVRQIEPGGNARDVLAGRVKLSLPSTERRLHLLIESDPDKKATTPEGQAAPTVSPAATPDSYAAALRYEKPKEEDKFFSADAGVRFQGITLHPFARARASFSEPLGTWRMKGTENLFWFNTTGAGETTQLDFEHFWSETVLLRASSTLTWLHDKQGFDASQSLTSFHTLDERHAVLYQASVTGGSQPQWQVAEYMLLMSYRQQLHRKWMFFEFSPQLHFPQTANYRASPVLLMRLEMLFDESK